MLETLLLSKENSVEGLREEPRKTWSTLVRGKKPVQPQALQEDATVGDG